MLFVSLLKFIKHYISKNLASGHLIWEYFAFLYCKFWVYYKSLLNKHIFCNVRSVVSDGSSSYDESMLLVNVKLEAVGVDRSS